MNPDPARWGGVPLPFEAADLARVVVEVFSRRMKVREISMAKAKLNTGVSLYAGAQATIRLADKRGLLVV